MKMADEMKWLKFRKEDIIGAGNIVPDWHIAYIQQEVPIADVVRDLQGTVIHVEVGNHGCVSGKTKKNHVYL